MSANVSSRKIQQLPEAEPADAAAERSPKPKFHHLGVVLVSFGLLCVLQGILNISLRLAKPTDKGEVEEESCPLGWITFASGCYYVSTQRRDWNNSRNFCLLRDSDLVVINSRQELAFLTGFTRAAWVGMTDREEEGTWIWVDGTPVNRDRSWWAPGQPDEAFDGDEDCGDLRTMNHFIGLNDYSCKARSQWICEKTLW